MATNALTESEKTALGLILNDLERIFSMEEIPFEKLDSVITKLKSNEARNYLISLRTGSKPEAALRESFFAGNSILSRYLFGEKAPEVRAEKLGFIDYVVGESTRFILLELKSLFESTGKGLRQTTLKPDQHKEQILKYFQTGARFAILTNLKDWYLFNDLVRPKDFKPYSSGALADFLKDYDMVLDLWNVLEHREKASTGKDLDKIFFESLRSWVSKLREVEFNTEEKRKDELIISLINKFIFIQTLDSYWVVSFRRIKTSWEDAEKDWGVKGKLVVLEKFFGDIDEWFYAYYDTELFRTKILDYVKKTSPNIERFYESIQLILGLAYWQGIFESYRGIMQYNFKLIDEDVFGKAYETFLAEIRHDEGIYYTPTFVTQYIVESTVGNIFNSLLQEIREAAEKEEIDGLEQLVSEFVSIKVLDPACGSGSFLVKAVRNIWDRYIEASEIIKPLVGKYDKYEGKLTRPKEVEEKAEKIARIRMLLKSDSPRELIARILVRHIHANDADPKALEVAKVNLWLESVKLAPTEFNYQKLPPDTNRILPDLEMNLGNGDSVVGLPFEYAVALLEKAHREELRTLTALREEYLDDPTKSDLIGKIQEVKNGIRTKLDAEFALFLEEKKLPKKALEATSPFHWPLEYWYMFFDRDGKPLGKDAGAHVVVGNPPYERIQVMQKKSPEYVDYLDKIGFRSASKGNYDLAVIFSERGHSLLRSGGCLGYIITNKFMTAEYGEGLRSYIVQENACKEIVNFGHQQVFEDATTYTALIFLTKGASDNVTYALIKKLERSLEQLRKIEPHEFEDDTLAVLSFPTTKLTSEPWSFASSAEQKILDRLSAYPKFGGAARIFVGLQTSADDVYIMDYVGDVAGGKELMSRADGKQYVLENELIKPLISGTDVKRYEVPPKRQFIIFPYEIVSDKSKLIPIEEIKQRYPHTHDYLVKNKQTLEAREKGIMKGPNWHGYVYLKNMNKQELPKLCVPRLVMRIQSFYDSKGEFYLDNVDVGGVIFEGKDAHLHWYVCGLLNSALLTFCLRRISTRFRGGWVSCNKQYLSQLPIIVPKVKAPLEQMEKLVRRIVDLKKESHELMLRWSQLAIGLKDIDTSLFSILKTDLDYSKKGQFAKCWTKSVSFYPHEDQPLLDRVFQSFRVEGEEREPSLIISAIDENGHEHEVYKAHFQTRPLMLHVYHSVALLLQSRSKVNTLRSIFQKTLVPVINGGKTESIIAKLTEDLGERNSDIVKLNAQIAKSEAQIDAEVFKTYGLSKAETGTVLDSTGLSVSYKTRVLEYFS
jgi:type I restriction-modification system DNA methylase subunit